MELPSFETARLVLRPHRSEDVPALHRLRADVDVARLMPRKPAASLAETEAAYVRMQERVARGEVFPLTVTLRGDDAMIGLVGFASFERANNSAKMAWELDRAFWGRGLMAEAAARLVAHGFESLGLHRIEAHVDPRNEPSSRLAARLGFTREGVLRDNYLFDGSFYDTTVFAKLATD